MRRAAGVLGSRGDDLREGLGYTLKRRLLGPPMVNEELGEQRLSNVLALGVLAPDGISSSAYGTEDILIELLKGGLAITAFTLILPMTGVVLFVIALVVLSYREVVTVYTRAGGSYVVARDNFGPRVAQVAAVALLIDYVVTVAVQIAAGTAAVASALPEQRPAAQRSRTVLTIISICVVLLMAYGNLRGITGGGQVVRACRPTCSPAVMILVIVVGLAREAFGDLGHRPFPVPGQYGYGHCAQLQFADHVRADLRAAALVRQRWLVADRHRGRVQRGQRVPAARGDQRPQGAGHRGHHPGHAGGRDLLAGARHARRAVRLRRADRDLPGSPASSSATRCSVSIMFFLVQAATALILYHRRQHQLQRVPVPGQLRGRGRVPAPLADQTRAAAGVLQRDHRADRAVRRAAGRWSGPTSNNLVPFYAIGVFTAFTMAGFGMAKYHHTHREQAPGGAGW